MSLRSYPDCHPLVVDDDPGYLLIVHRIFAKVGVPHSQVRSCADGEEAVKILSGGWMPSFALLDLKMPKRSGLEVLEWVRYSMPLATVPFFMLTAGSDPKDVARAFELGISSYFTKPLEMDALEEILECILAYWKSPSRPAIIRGSLAPAGSVRPS